MIECQFCPAKTEAPYTKGWVQVDTEIFVCPTCIPTVSPQAPNPDDEDEIERKKNDYIKKFYSFE